REALAEVLRQQVAQRLHGIKFLWWRGCAARIRTSLGRDEVAELFEHVGQQMPAGIVRAAGISRNHHEQRLTGSLADAANRPVHLFVDGEQRRIFRTRRSSASSRPAVV